MVYSAQQSLSFLDNIDDFEKSVSEKELFVFLDYDGTLTPIVDRPEDALISAETQSLVKDLASAYKVSIVSGRATDDVRSKVQIEGLFYAGSHGFEIVCPEGEVEINDEAQAIRQTIDKVYQKLSHELSGVDGALVEHVKYTISAHYRLVSDNDFHKVEAAVDHILKNHPNLRKTNGKKVFEIRPNIDWDKGKAVDWILDVLQFDSKKDFAVYIGDDTTDEDAFKVLDRKGSGICVMNPLRTSYARYHVKNTDDVKDVLKYLIKVKS